MNRLLRWLFTPERVAPHHRDGIVILGASLRLDNTLSAAASERVEIGVELLKKGLGDWIVVCGGVGRYSRHVGREAEAMADYAVALGAPRERVLIEAESRDTAENARNTARLLPRNTKIWLVTQPFHLRRSILWFRRLGLDAVPWVPRDSIQYRDWRQELRWMGRESLSLLRDLTIRTSVPRGTVARGE